tara:strand:- start:3318 stop:3608 length:291 start_codon:yes stop_codon:yes gene_type:complete
MQCSLSDSLDISTVLDSAADYQEWLGLNSQLLIDASKVVRVDAAGVQALTSLFLSAKNHSIDIQLTQPTEVLVEAIRTLGLKDQIKWNYDFGEDEV